MNQPSVQEMEVNFLASEVRSALDVLTFKLKKGESLDQTIIFVQEAQAKLNHLENYALQNIKHERKRTQRTASESD